MAVPANSGTNGTVQWPPSSGLSELPVALFPPSWQHETFFSLCGLAATLGLLSCALCSLVLVRGARHGVLSQLLNSLVRADALFCLPMFVRAAAVAWDDWTFGDFVCKVTNYVFDSAQSLRAVFLVLLLTWHLLGHGWSQTAWDGVVFAAWLAPLGTGLVALLDAGVVGARGRRVCSAYSATMPLWHHVWYVSAVLTPTVLLAPLAVLTLALRRRRPLQQPHMLALSGLLTLAHLAWQTGALALIFVRRPAAGWALDEVVVPLLVSLPLLHPVSNLPCFFWLYPQFRATIHDVFATRQTRPERPSSVPAVTGSAQSRVAPEPATADQHQLQQPQQLQQQQLQQQLQQQQQQPQELQQQRRWQA